MQSLLVQSIAEFLGVLLVIIARMKYNNFIALGIAYLVAIILFMSVSGAYLNPITSFYFYMIGEITMTKFAAYTLAQLLAVAVALRFSNM